MTASARRLVPDHQPDLIEHRIILGCVGAEPDGPEGIVGEIADGGIAIAEGRATLALLRKVPKSPRASTAAQA